MFMGCPRTFLSKVQHQIDLITMETEYSALPHSIHEIIGIGEVIKEIQTFIISGETQNPKYRTHFKAFVPNYITPPKVYEDNEACL